MYKLILGYVKELFEWDISQTEALANMVVTRGLQAEMSSVRKYLSVIRNFYTFQIFNPSYAFSPEGDFVLHLLIMKEAWRPLYEEIVKEAFKDRLSDMGSLIINLIESYKSENRLLKEQENFLHNYFINSVFPFHQFNLSEWLSSYPSLA